MHFDILVPETLKDTAIIHSYGQEYLATKPYKTEVINTSICNYCHVEVAPPEVVVAIKKQGYYILPLALLQVLSGASAMGLPLSHTQGLPF